MEQQGQRSDHRSTVMWLLIAAVGFLGGWIVHDELSTSAAAATTPAAAVTAAPGAAAPATVVPVVVAVTAAPGSTGSTGSPGGVAVSVTTPQPAATPSVTTAPDAATPSRPSTSVPASAGLPPTTATGDGRSTTAATPAPAAGSSTTWNVVMASDGSVVLMGANGRLLANTGHASGGATVALDADATLIQTGVSAEGATPVAAVAGHGGTATSSARSVPVGAGAPVSLDAVLPGGLADVEDHSVHVVGAGQIVTNDDSNAFLDRNGQINSNTGDTDSSAVNALDVTQSRIRSGSSAGVPDEPGEDEIGDAETTAATDLGDPTSAAAPTTPPEPPAATEGAEFQDVSVHTTGTRNAVTQDDSSLIRGGTGHVNAQAGDSDTAGIVAMGVHDAEIESGCAGTMCSPTPAGTP